MCSCARRSRPPNAATPPARSAWPPPPNAYPRSATATAPCAPSATPGRLEEPAAEGIRTLALLATASSARALGALAGLADHLAVDTRGTEVAGFRTAYALVAPARRM